MYSIVNIYKKCTKGRSRGTNAFTRPTDKKYRFKNKIEHQRSSSIIIVSQAIFTPLVPLCLYIYI